MVEGMKFIGIMKETIWLEQASVGIVLLKTVFIITVSNLQIVVTVTPYRMCFCMLGQADLVCQMKLEKVLSVTTKKE